MELTINPADICQLWPALAMFLLGMVQGFALGQRERK